MVGKIEQILPVVGQISLQFECNRREARGGAREARRGQDAPDDRGQLKDPDSSPGLFTRRRGLRARWAPLPCRCEEPRQDAVSCVRGGSHVGTF